jgi:nuclear transport factor 2 (NTF2) superfamily protein
VNDTEALRIVKAVEAAYQTRDIDKVRPGFHPECEITFAGRPFPGGLEAYLAFQAKEFAAMDDDFRITKTPRVLSGDRITVTWVANWTQDNTKRESHGLEIWQLDGDLLREWEFHATVYDL